jgi:Uma2 family endonuclease
MSNLAYAQNIDTTPDILNITQLFSKNPIAAQDYGMPVSHEGKYVDEATYWRDYYEDDLFRYEWNNGYLEVKEMPTMESSQNVRWLISILEQFIHVHPLAYFFIVDIGFKMKFPNRTTIRKPDISLILKNNPNPPNLKDRSYQGIYDMCIEFISDSRKKYVTHDTVTKKKEYGEAKVKEYYIIDTNKTHTSFFRLNRRGQYDKIKSSNGIICSTVLPGFQFREDDLYNTPDLNSLINDPVYRSFVRVDLQEAFQAVEIERKAKEDAIRQKTEAEKIIEKERQEIKRLKQLLSEKS